ncbi:hypothetical protein CLF_106790 [Clonorchis sinensis]|uniref:Uncharacterized protein n=1 Tax=Clonorchis sinensis TaxID=79923 RepID=G7YFQ0_CLOSI|nr:hypothetical protein CLF_106790 [Clonorchis sinensis]
MNASDSVITIAVTSLTYSTNDYCYASTEYRGTVYKKIKLLVIPNLRADVLLGHNFLGLYNQVEITFIGNRGPLTLGGLTAATVESPPLFANLRPHRHQSRPYKIDDEQFIQSEVSDELHTQFTSSKLDWVSCAETSSEVYRQINHKH